MAKKPLEGIKVAAFTWWAAGPLTAKSLASFGAEVINMEGRTVPDGLRIAGPNCFKDGVEGVNRSGIFNEYHTGQKSAALNLSKPSGIEAAKKILAKMDVVIETMAGGVLARLGLGYDDIKKTNPNVIMLSSCIQGQKGPYANLPGFGHHGAGLTGVNQVAGWPDREPATLGVYTDLIAPRYAVLAILSALEYRRRTGKGIYIDMSQVEKGIIFSSPDILDYTTNERVANRAGNRSPYAAPHGAYACDGTQRFCTIGVFTDEEWQSFCNVIGNPKWTKDSKFSTLSARKKNEDELDKLVGEWTITRKSEDIMNTMQAAGVPAGVVQNPEDIMEKDPQIKHRNSFPETEHPEIGKYHPPGHSYIMSKSPYEIKHACLLGEDNEYVLKEIAGMSDEEITEAIIEGGVE